MQSYYEKTDLGVRFFIRLSPNASQNCVVGRQEDAEGSIRLKAKVTAIPEKGKANKALIKLLSKELGYPQSAFTILSGETDRNKTLLLKGDIEEIAKTLEDWP